MLQIFVYVVFSKSMFDIISFFIIFPILVELMDFAGYISLFFCIKTLYHNMTFELKFENFLIYGLIQDITLFFNDYKLFTLWTSEKPPFPSNINKRYRSFNTGCVLYLKYHTIIDFSPIIVAGQIMILLKAN